MQNNSNSWDFWIDRGGTFTDIVALKPDGKLLTHKLLSDNPEQYEDAAIEGIRQILNLGKDETLPAEKIASIRMGTTVGTNALLERRGEPTVLVITERFRDILKIGYQNRPSIFALDIKKPEVLYEEVIEVRQRYSSDGTIVTPLNCEDIKEKLMEYYHKGYRSVAVALMHSFRYPAHEEQIEKIAHNAGYTNISLSHRTSPLSKLVARAETTVVDAYLSPVLEHYVNLVRNKLNDQKNSTDLFFMQSSGGLVDGNSFRGKDSILSGPAGGIVGSAEVCRMAGFDRVISFDMGGTSTDVAHYRGEMERTLESTISGTHLHTPMLNIHTVAAGGGSILHFEDGRFQAGPDSAGADPGPACYRKGGPLTVTDCNVMLGKISPQNFPRIFGENADLSLDREIVVEKFCELAEEIKLQTGKSMNPEEVAEGFLKVAVENMANAIKHISVKRGYNLEDYILCCFGGAGAQHAGLVADSLGIEKILIHPFAGVLSAYGMGLADRRVIEEKALEKYLEEGIEKELTGVTKNLSEKGMERMLATGDRNIDIETVERVRLKYEGTETTFDVPYGPIDEMTKMFYNLHIERFGFVSENRKLVVDSVYVEIIGKNQIPAETTHLLTDKNPKPASSKEVYMEGRWHRIPLFTRDVLKPGNRITGPALIMEDTTTIVLERKWQACVTEHNHLLLEKKMTKSRPDIGTEVNPVMLEIFNNRFMSVAEQMGYRLRNAAHSVNIKERLDFSCAIFDGSGNLVANAPHIPVHLGSMEDAVKEVIRNHENDFSEGDTYILNSPYHGGTHLPDITAVSPLISNGKPQFYVASRGHHADIGGITPGSMPPLSKRIEEEGVLIEEFKLTEQGKFREEEFVELFNQATYPPRNPDQNIADLKAQIAANQKGIEELRKLVDTYSLKTITAYMQHVQDNAEMAVEKVIDILEDGDFEYTLDDDSKIAVRLRIDRDNTKATIDFTNTSPQTKSNFNAPSAVCKAAVLYVFRTLVQDDIPLNSGCLRPITIIIPDNSMLNPSYPAAVVAGNVETSQYIVDCLYGALGILAPSQGTMNNFTFGNDRFQYYETICGGAGAGNGFDGEDAVQTHMTNSLITDPEIMELRFPVRIKEFSIRRGSGGAGKYQGGNGVIRKIRFLKKMKAAILSSHRKYPPKGMAGGETASTGENILKKKSGQTIELSAADEMEVEEGDVFIIKTPGGGGYGNRE
jgi:5-oxoprolinase (ATP-hydrolysing)